MAILIPKEKPPKNTKNREESLLITGKPNGQYWEWVCSWRIEVVPSGLCVPQNSPSCTLWLSVLQLQTAAGAQIQAKQVRRKTSSKTFSDGRANYTT